MFLSIILLDLITLIIFGEEQIYEAPHCVTIFIPLLFPLA